MVGSPQMDWRYYVNLKVMYRKDDKYFMDLTGKLYWQIKIREII